MFWHFLKGYTEKTFANILAILLPCQRNKQCLCRSFKANVQNNFVSRPLDWAWPPSPKLYPAYPSLPDTKGKHTSLLCCRFGLCTTGEVGRMAKTQGNSTLSRSFCVAALLQMVHGVPPLITSLRSWGGTSDLLTLNYCFLTLALIWLAQPLTTFQLAATSLNQSASRNT